MGLSTGIGVGFTFGFAAPPYDTTTIPGRLWHFRANAVTVGGGTTTATDLSGAGHDLVNSGAAGTQPALTTFPGSSAPSLYFDGGDKMPCATSILPVTAGVIYTAIIVTRYDDTSSRIALDLTTGAGAIAIGQGVSGSNTLIWKKGAVFDLGPAAVANTAQWIAIVFKTGAGSGYTSKTYINGALYATSLASSNVLVPAGTGFTVGDYLTAPGNFPMKGYVPEGLLILGDASALVPQISTYMVARYGTPG